jgi:hypothetical protein
MRTHLPVSILILIVGSPHGQAVRPESASTFIKIYAAVEAIRDNFGVPVGLEVANSDPDDTPITLAFDCNDVAHGLDQIIGQRQAHRWSREDGVYDVYPKARNEQMSGLRIKVFAITDATRTEALIAVDKLPEVQNWRSHHREQGGVLISQVGFPDQQRVSVNFRNSSLRHILNWLSTNVATNPQKPEWSVVPYGDETKHLNIAF